MGLDVRSMPFIEHAPDVPVDNDGVLDEERCYELCLHFEPYSIWQASVVRGFEAQADGIQDGQTFRVLASGGPSLGYGAYNAWRDQLAKRYSERGLIERHTNGEDVQAPFLELINFPDHEGTLGPQTSAKLAQDFARFAVDARQDTKWFAKIYSSFHLAFASAAWTGAVEFF